MRVFEGKDKVEKKNCVVSVGMFDGIHKGHQKMIEIMNKKADELNTESMVFTFEIHPRKILNSAPPKLLMTKENKIKYLKKFNVDNVVFLKFNKKISKMTAEEFVEEIFVKKLDAAAVIIGKNHKFGNKQHGDYSFLKSISKKYDFEVVQVPLVCYDNKRISSTWIRETIIEGKLRLTKELLNRFYFIEGYVERGSGRGKDLGYPTANLEGIEAKLPIDGVYSSYVEYEGEKYAAMAYIGYSPTYNENNRKVEVHIFDFDENIYGEELKVYFVAKIRNEKYFDDEESLKKKLMIDKNITLSILADEELLF